MDKNWREREGDGTLGNYEELSSKKVKLKDNSILLFEGLHAINKGMLSFIPDKMKYKILKEEELLSYLLNNL